MKEHTINSPPISTYLLVGKGSGHVSPKHSKLGQIGGFWLNKPEQGRYDKQIKIKINKVEQIIRGLACHILP